MREVTLLTKDLTAYAEFMARIGSVDPAMADAIRRGAVVLRDHTLYTARHIGAQTQVELCVANDAKAVGLTNFDRRRLEANTYFIITGIRLLTGDSEKATEAEYRPLSGTQLNGELELKVGNKTVLSALSLREFASTDPDRQGFYRLEAPFMLIPQTEFIPTIKLSKEGGANTCIRIEFHGVITASK